jgi:dienelactone hydrolase
MPDGSARDSGKRDAPTEGSGGRISTDVSNNDSGTDAAVGATDAAFDDAGRVDGAVQANPQPVDPCSEDLQAEVGHAQPDFGAIPTPTAFMGDPDAMGPFAVFKRDVTIPNPHTAGPALDATFYAPSTDAGTSIADGKFAFALVMHGFGTTHRSYEHFTLHLASHGFVALGITLPFSGVAMHDKNAAQAIAAIDYALGDPAAAAITPHIDATKVAILGHSFGGKIAFYAAALDPRVDLVVGWDPSNAGGPPCFIDPAACNGFPVAPNCAAKDSGIIHQLRAETLVFRAAPDGANPEPGHNAVNFFRGAPEPATLVDYDTTVLHGDFANPLAAVVPRARRIHLAFLLNRFYGTTGLDAWLPRGAEIGAGAVRVLYKP